MRRAAHGAAAAKWRGLLFFCTLHTCASSSSSFWAYRAATPCRAPSWPSRRGRNDISGTSRGLEESKLLRHLKRIRGGGAWETGFDPYASHFSRRTPTRKQERAEAKVIELRRKQAAAQKTFATVGERNVLVLVPAAPQSSPGSAASDTSANEEEEENESMQEGKLLRQAGPDGNAVEREDRGDRGGGDEGGEDQSDDSGTEEEEDGQEEDEALDFEAWRRRYKSSGGLQNQEVKFETKAARDLRLEMQKKVYEWVVVRVRLPNGIHLQGRFHLDDSVDDIHAMVLHCLHADRKEEEEGGGGGGSGAEEERGGGGGGGGGGEGGGGGGGGGGEGGQQAFELMSPPRRKLSDFRGKTLSEVGMRPPATLLHLHVTEEPVSPRKTEEGVGGGGKDRRLVQQRQREAAFVSKLRTDLLEGAVPYARRVDFPQEVDWQSLDAWPQQSDDHE